jgi:hypothetical protein
MLAKSLIRLNGRCRCKDWNRLNEIFVAAIASFLPAFSGPLLQQPQAYLSVGDAAGELAKEPIKEAIGNEHTVNRASQ